MNIIKRTILAVPLLAAVLLAGCGKTEDPASVKTKVSVTTSETSMTVSWGAINGAAGYEVQYADNEDMGNAVSEQSEGTSLTITGLSSGGIYYVRVRARLGSGWGVWSDVKTVMFTPLRIVVENYNILGDQHADKSPWPDRKAAMGAIVLQDSNFPDVIGLQECASTPQMNDVINMLKDKYNYIAANNTYMSPRLVLWKKDMFEVVDTKIVDMTPGKYPDTYRGSRYALQVHLRERSSGREFLFFNIHLRSGGDVPTAALRKEMIDYLAPYAKNLSAELGGLPVIILGDMNSRPETVLGGIPSSPKVFAGHGFQDTFTMTANRINQNYSTYNTQENVDNCTVTYSAGGAWRIDYTVVWPAERFRVEACEIVLNFTDQSALKVECPIPSDHNPVRSTLLISY